MKLSSVSCKNCLKENEYEHEKKMKNRKWDSSHWDRDLVTKIWKKCQISKMEMDLSTEKWDFDKNELGNGIATPTPFRTLCKWR